MAKENGYSSAIPVRCEVRQARNCADIFFVGATDDCCYPCATFCECGSPASPTKKYAGVCEGCRSEMDIDDFERQEGDES